MQRALLGLADSYLPPSFLAMATAESLQYVIYSPNESALADSDGGYWSAGKGWGFRPDATVFTVKEACSMALPASLGEDARLLPFREQVPVVGRG